MVHIVPRYNCLGSNRCFATVWGGGGDKVEHAWWILPSYPTWLCFVGGMSLGCLWFWGSVYLGRGDHAGGREVCACVNTMLEK